MDAKLSEIELDELYTQLCRTMTEIGEKRTPLFLARFALLAMTTIGDGEVVRQLIADAAEDSALRG